MIPLRLGLAVIAILIQLTASILIFVAQRDGHPNQLLLAGPGIRTGEAFRDELAALPPAQRANALDNLAPEAFCNVALPPTTTLYLLGDATPLYFTIPVLYNTTWDSWPLAEAMRAAPGDPAAWSRALLARGVRFVLVNPTEIERLTRSGWIDPLITAASVSNWLSQAAKPVKQWPGVGLFELLPSPARRRPPVDRPCPEPQCAPPRQRRLIRVAVQVVGFAAGLASLGWCISQAFKSDAHDPVNKFERLLHAPRQLLVGMFALSFATLVINGLLFWVGLFPVRRLRPTDVVATNGICSFLAYLPLKAGAIARVLIHNRRDGIPVLTIGAWFGSMAVVIAAAFGPLILAMLLLNPMSPTWFAAVAAMQVSAAASAVIGARLFRGQRGIDRLTAIAQSLHLAPIKALLRSGVWARLHPGFDMLASAGAVAAAMVLRAVDVCIHSGRFLVAAHILGVHLPLSQALPISLTFFVVGVVSPAGMAGLREGAATGLAAILLTKAGATEDSYRDFAKVALLVSATEAIVFLASAAMGIAWLRPQTLLRLRAPATSPDSPPPV